MPGEQQTDLLVGEWLRRAEDDARHLRANLDHRDGSAAAVCLIAHQMAEKLLKALLIARTGDYRRTHHLEELVALLEPVVPRIRAALHDPARTLEPHYIGARYPADVPLESYTWDEAEQAFAAAQAIERFVLGRLGRTNPTASEAIA